jgi:hypothetical protein
MYDRVLERRNHEDFRIGVLAATMANFSMGRDPDKPPLEPQDFFPWLPGAEPQEMSGEDMFEFLKGLAVNKPVN